jgi:hypothetical protein
MDRPRRSQAIYTSPKETFGTLKKALVTTLQVSLPNGERLRLIAIDGVLLEVLKGPSAIKETTTSSRQDIWAELRYVNEPLSTQIYSEIPVEQMKRTKKERNTYSQISGLEKTEELQLP